MPFNMTLADARTIVLRDAAATKAPTLTNAEVDALLTETANAVVWLTAQTYEYGTVIVPTVRNGRRYKVVRGGTSGTVEPDWSSSLWARQEATSGTALFEAYAPDFGNIWNLRAATNRAWLLKAAKANDMISASADGQSMETQQVYDHCIDMARRWAPVTIA